MNIYMIRHGRQSSRLCNVNVELSEEGRRQAGLLGKRLLEVPVDIVYSSDLIRAVETAQTANEYWKVRHVIRPELREISFGEMEGLSDQVIAERYGEFKERQDRMEEDLAYPGGECAADVVRRAMPVFREIGQSGYKNVVVITHGGLIRSVTAAMIGLPLSRCRMLGNGLENCGITKVVYHPLKDRFTLERFNDYAHLEQTPELLRGVWVEKEN